MGRERKREKSELTRPLRSRRKFLAGVSAAGLATIAGCASDDGSGSSNDSGMKDSDGDGMIDSEDYAPKDPEVQEKSDLQGGTEGSGTDTGGSNGGGDDGSDRTSTATPGDISYPSHTGTHTISARDNYWAWKFSVPAEFTLTYTAPNMLDENLDFDVLLYPPDRFAEYRAIATEQKEGIRPEYMEGSAPGVESGVEATVTLPAGTYHLVLDNTDLSDAGDWGTEDTRRVRLVAKTRAP